MSTRQKNNAYRIEGNLALSAPASREGFRVLEGGRATGHKGHSSSEACTEYARSIGAMLAVFAIAVTLLGVAFAQSFLRERHRAELIDQAALETVIVHSGTTLWQIAEEHPLVGYSTIEQIAAIREINHLESADLRVGMELQVPTLA